MKTLIIVRHAKAESMFDDDFNRELTDQGCRDAKYVSSVLKSLQIAPQRWIASSAKRAWQTASIFIDSLQADKSILEPWEELYHDVTTSDFLEKIHATKPEFNQLIVFGHNPTLHYIIDNLCTSFDRNTPPCATAIVQFDVDTWQEIEARQGQLIHHITPQNTF